MVTVLCLRAIWNLINSGCIFGFSFLSLFFFLVSSFETKAEYPQRRSWPCHFFSTESIFMSVFGLVADANWIFPFTFLLHELTRVCHMVSLILSVAFLFRPQLPIPQGWVKSFGQYLWPAFNEGQPTLYAWINIYKWLYIDVCMCQSNFVCI